MYKTFEEAKIAILEAVVRHGYKRMEFVVVERKMTKNAKYTWFNFRRLVNETFNPFWREEKDYSFTRMVEVVRCNDS